MRAEELMVGDLLIVNKDGLCIKKGSVVRVRGIDADNTFRFGELLGSATCRPLDNTQFDGGIWCDYLDPIPLTPEILEKNEFKNISVVIIGTRKMRWVSDDTRTEITIWMDDTLPMEIVKNVYYEDEVTYTLPFPCTVSQLQHSLRLCGIKKEIMV